MMRIDQNNEMDNTKQLLFWVRVNGRDYGLEKLDLLYLGYTFNFRCIIGIHRRNLKGEFECSTTVKNSSQSVKHYPNT